MDRVGGKLARSVLVKSAAAPEVAANFAALGLIPELHRALVDINIGAPTEVQVRRRRAPARARARHPAHPTPPRRRSRSR